MATWTEKVQEHYATCIDHWDTHMHDYMNSDFKEQFWVSYFQDQVHIMEMKETMKKRSKIKKFQVMELENALIHKTVSSPTFWKEQILNLIQKNTQLQVICCQKKNGAY